MKIHLHDTSVIRPAVQILETQRDKLKQPVWIHADIFEGPNMPEGAKLVDRDTFLVRFKKYVALIKD